ncbi:AAA domain protein [compost metagenome]
MKIDVRDSQSFIEEMHRTAAEVDSWSDDDPEPTKVRKSGWRADAPLASEIPVERIDWLWPGWVARGKLSVLAGQVSAGKSTLCFTMAGIVSTGARWPTGEPGGDPAGVIIWSTEDDAKDVIVPRLHACGADLDRIRIVRGRVNENGECEPFTGRDIDLLDEVAEALGGVSLLIVDPVVSMVAGDLNAANIVRQSLQPLVNFAERHHCAIVGLSHFSKNSTGSSPVNRVLGSQAFGALARTVLVAARNESDGNRVLCIAKSNISVDDGGLGYAVEPTTITVNGLEIETIRIVWGNSISGTAREILAIAEGTFSEGDDDGALVDAKDFLLSLLKNGPLPTTVIKSESQGADYSWSTIRRAKESLGVIVSREGEPGRRGGGVWSWRLPSDLDAQAPFEHLNKSPNEHLNQTALGRALPDHEEGENRLRCPSQSVGTLIKRNPEFDENAPFRGGSSRDAEPMNGNRYPNKWTDE